MRHRIGASVFIILLAMVTSVSAQSDDAAESDAAAGNAGLPGLSMGTTEASPGQPYVKEEFLDWQLRCVRAEGDAEICQLYQLMDDTNGNAVAELNVFPLPEGQQAAAGATIVTPLETLLTANLRLAVDSGQAKVYPFSFCNQVGCFARIGLTADELASFRAGNQATITIVPALAPNETVELSLSLSGFTAGYNALVETDKARLEAQGQSE
ncbi:MAG: invasion associated locus B family protein [Pseudomonadota bacterium]